ncbi:MAG: hypothetical protein U0361_05895 [Nitrospiraceae bacterium]
MRTQGESRWCWRLWSLGIRGHTQHWHRPPYVLWPIQFMTQKVRTYIRLMRELPVTGWPSFWQES